jgi:hypothetical protein
VAYKILAGDFPEGTKLDVTLGIFRPVIPHSSGVTKPLEFASVEAITEENKKKFIGAAGWGLVGAAALGPIGALAGILAGGNKKTVCAACVCKDGNKFLVEVDQKTFKKMVAATF